ncbi:hypothetical protein G6F57_023273 [Rhizopus arrhizus]|nr:hypothetical protein G6F57_023273 [Rhizopus arrhizus]
MFDDQRRGGGMTTYHHTKAAILKTFNFFGLSSRKFGNGETIFEFWADKSSIDPSAQEKRKALAIHANLVENTH